MYNPPALESIGRLMAAFRAGDSGAASELFELLYPELRRLAAARMKGERTEHTWQPTVLVNELYLTLVKVKALGGDEKGQNEKAAFMSLAGHVMKRLLIDHARPLYRRAEKVELAEMPVSQSAESLQFVEEALCRLASIDPRLRAVVEMRVFEGLTGDEIAQQLGCSPRSVANWWTFAKRWLQKEVAGPGMIDLHATD
jgi:RNA polymerase sigma factor (TIGR02999 family)